MNQELEESSGWNLSEDDKALLSRLHKALLRFIKPLAWCGNELIALGEACDAIEKILEDEPIDISVGLTIGFRSGDSDFEEGRFACLRLDESEIRLDELHTTYSSEVGSDHSTVDYALLRSNGSFAESGVAEWLGQLKDICFDERTTLSVERDHV